MVNTGYLRYSKWTDRWPNMDFFDSDGTIHYKEPKQGSTGTCAFINAAAGIAEWPDLVRDLFVTKTKNDAGIIGVKLYIRGKPWVISLDSDMWFYQKNSTFTELIFAKESADGKAIWGAILEKALAKVKGNYINTNAGDLLKNGLATLTGVPVYSRYTIGDGAVALD